MVGSSNVWQLKCHDKWRTKGTAVSEAVVQYKVLHQTLRDRLSGHVAHGTNPGPKPYLTNEEKETILSFQPNLVMEKLEGKPWIW